MIHVPVWMEFARDCAKEGVIEMVRDQHNPLIIEFGRSVSLSVGTDEIPWCSNFVNWCMQQAGIERTKSAMARSWLKWGQRLPLIYPAFGCVVIIKRGGGNQPERDVINAKGHVGFFVDQPTPSEIIILGGNQSNQVCERTYRIERVLDYRWPSE